MIGQVCHRNEICSHPDDGRYSAYLTFIGDDRLACLIVPGIKYPDSALLLADLEAISEAHAAQYPNSTNN
jgi:hypothetical protein